MNRLLKLLHYIGIDKSIAYSSGGRVVQGLTGLASVYFIGTYLSPEGQGYYFTFGSVLALQVFFELGLHNVLTQFTAHEKAHIEQDKYYNLIGESRYISRLSSILRFSVNLFAAISLVFAIVITCLGIYFFRSSTAPENGSVEWLTPWIILSILSAVSLFMSPIYAILMGLSRVKDVSKIRFLQSVFMPLSVWTGLLLGLKLYVLPLSSFISSAIGIFCMWRGDMFKQLNKIWIAYGSERVNYIHETFPLQWKMALSWISGYFIYQLFNPILFRYVGAEAAGQMGMTMQVLNAIQAFSFSWMSTKIPTFSTYIARHEFASLDSLFKKTLIQLLSVCILILIAFIMVLNFIDLILPIGISERFLYGLPLIIISFSIIPNQILSSLANYLRCYKKEPLVFISIIIALLCTASSFICTQLYGLDGMVCGYTFIITFIELPWIYAIYKNKRHEWQTSLNNNSDL